MIHLPRILLPTDFSENSKCVAAYACAMADQFGSELHVLHVLQDLVAMVPEPGLPMSPLGDIQELRQSAQAALDQVPDAAWAAAKTVVRVIRQGPAFVEIVRYAKEQDIRLIVIGTHGRSGLAHVLMGSVAERVVRKAPCPVLTVRPKGHQFVMP